jgi:hypothetical protein
VASEAAKAKEGEAVRRTPEEIKEAREWLARQADLFGGLATVHIETLIAATEPPTDEELRAEANRIAESDELHEALDGLDRCDFYAQGYEDGIRDILGTPEGK